VQLGLEPVELLRLAEDVLRHLRPVDLAVRCDLGPPPLDQQVAHLIGAEQLVSDAIGRECRRAQPLGCREGL
jgi:hypothetical protein